MTSFERILETSIAVELSASIISGDRRDRSIASRSSRSAAVLVDPLLDRGGGLADGQQLAGQPLARRLGGVDQRSCEALPISAICSSTGA